MTLLALTDEAVEALRGQTAVSVPNVPFKVGRECRLLGTEAPSPTGLGRIAGVLERRLGKVPQLNDLYLVEWPSAEGFHISREHFMIDRRGSALTVIDRGSASGTRVGDITLGADWPARWTALHEDDIIVVGGRHSPYRFQFRLTDS